ncbi:N-benzyl-3-pyrrolidinol dehydrogenase [Paecilomyces variotii No. 5]|uniref:N-benzyl-3-pyrrolidinol dehydrogenase n=1 Tax=Byssochlamys spectabilis (strain No. 5 / NBRC 109023) TaxID=1356009 RepID=V5FBE7_BYSSN|nr:N-benzyl-3-pyrrolidinol dehydrogenase [Paecilomyces variotii No. 5]
MTTAVPQKMLAWQKHLPSKTPIRVEVDVPTPKRDEILVKIRAAGVCHSDYGLKEMETLPAEFAQARSKFTYGHEGCGQVVSIGPEVKQFKPGDSVSMICVPGCGSVSCHECSAGVPQICQKGPRYGGGQDGFFAPFAVVRERAAIKLPKGVSAAAGAVATDARMTAYHAVVNRAAVKTDDTVLIIGLGGLGFNALQVVLSIGARPVVVDQRQSILDEARVIGVKSEDIVPVDADITDWFLQKNLQVDKVVDFVAVQATFEAAINSVRPAGTVVVAAMQVLNLMWQHAFI